MMFNTQTEDKIKIQKITITGLAINIFISVVKFVLGFLGNSQAVIADAVHSFSDTSTDFIILFGVKYWTAPPDDAHPYGHQKIESFASVLIGLVLVITAAGIGYNSLININNLDHTEIIPLKLFTIIGPILSIIFKEFLFRKTYKLGVEINSSSLKANAWHHRTDALSSIPVLITVIISSIFPKLVFLDQIGAIIVAAFILKLAFEIIFKNINELIDTSICITEKEKISLIISKNKNVKGFHKLRSRKLGSSIYLDLHLEVDGDLTVTEGHTISEDVKKALIESNPKIIDVMVHLEPEE